MKKIKHQTKQEALEVVKSEGRELEFCSHEWRNDRDVVLEAVKNCSYAVQYASPEFYSDFEIMIPEWLLKLRLRRLNKLIQPASKFFGNFWRGLIQALSDPQNKGTITTDRKRWNSIIDTFIIMSSQLAGSILVTTEVGKVISVYQETGQQHKVLNAVDYIQMIEKM